MGAGGGRVIFQDLANGWRGESHDGNFEFVSSDSDFSCAFSDCASSSGGPIQIFAIDAAGRRFVDVTRSRPDLVRADAAEQWRAYRGEIVLKQYWRVNHPGYEPMGLLAPWCGDQYLLGRKDRCDRVLAHALAQGYLNGPHGGRAAINLLDKTLAAWGYERG